MTDIDEQWASSRVEAMADGSLPPEDERRMRAAIALNPRLGSSVEQAVALRAELKHLAAVAVPASLRRRLLAIAAGDRAARLRLPSWAWAAGVTAAVAVAAATFALLEAQRAREREAAALEQVELAMTYLKRGSEVAGGHVRQAVRTGVVAAAATSNRALRDEKPAPPANGDGA